VNLAREITNVTLVGAFGLEQRKRIDRRAPFFVLCVSLLSEIVLFYHRDSASFATLLPLPSRAFV